MHPHIYMNSSRWSVEIRFDADFLLLLVDKCRFCFECNDLKQTLSLYYYSVSYGLLHKSDNL